ncbi:MAG TPA: SGNH/GDSL hydrolase family protein [Sedimentisphaerales bacterium]|nr:SGNH/GDSL hydrolase family protein [Sedimentisphaerales bacterium]
MADRIELRDGNTILFIGDSITDADRRSTSHSPLGRGYVNFAANLVVARHPEIDLKVVNTGISGNTVRDLKRRWRQDCLDHRPDVLSVMIGINDLWRRFDSRPEQVLNAVYPEEYENTYRDILAEARSHCNPQMILMEPFMFCSAKENKMFQGLGPYIEAVHRLAGEFGAVVVPLQIHINKALKTVPSAKWAGDMVHPATWAHAWIAERWLDAVGL